MDILKSSQLVVLFLQHFPTEVLQVFSSNSYEVRGGENRKWRWIFALDRCVLAHWLTGSLADWLTGWLADWLTGWLADWLTGWLADWLTGWLADWLTGWLADWLTGSLHWFTDSLAHWLTDSLTDSLIDRLIEIFFTIILYLPWLPSLCFESKMADISSSNSVVLFDDIPVSLTRTGIWYCLSKHLPDNKKQNWSTFFAIEENKIMSEHMLNYWILSHWKRNVLYTLFSSHFEILFLHTYHSCAVKTCSLCSIQSEISRCTKVL